jgi:hypothetical protein
MFGYEIKLNKIRKREFIMSLGTLIAAGTAAASLLLGGGAVIVNASTTDSDSTSTVQTTSTSTTSGTTTSETAPATSTKGGPKTGNGRGEGPTVDRSDMGAEQLAQVKSDEANGAPQQDGSAN